MSGQKESGPRLGSLSLTSGFTSDTSQNNNRDSIDSQYQIEIPLVQQQQKQQQQVRRWIRKKRINKSLQKLEGQKKRTVSAKKGTPINIIQKMLTRNQEAATHSNHLKPTIQQKLMNKKIHNSNQKQSICQYWK
ncbi:hypothetical protein ABPG72_017580 [Tetrahymena utriculariae]